MSAAKNVSFCFCHRMFINDVQSKLNNLQQQQQAGGAGANYDATKFQNDFKNMLTNVQNDVRVIATKQAVSYDSGLVWLRL